MIWFLFERFIPSNGLLGWGFGFNNRVLLDGGSGFGCS